MRRKVNIAGYKINLSFILLLTIIPLTGLTIATGTITDLIPNNTQQDSASKASESDVQSTRDNLSLSISTEDPAPGKTVKIKASIGGRPAAGADIDVSGKEIGPTNANGIQGYTIPEDQRNITMEASYNGKKAILEKEFGDKTSETESDTRGTQNTDNTSQDEQNTNQEDSDQNQETGTSEINLQISPPTAGELNAVEIIEDGKPASNTAVYIDNEQIGTTTTSGEVSFTVPNTQEIDISTDADVDAQSFTVSGYTQQPQQLDIEASFIDTIYQGRNNTLSVVSNGSALANATVYLNQIQKGQTDSNGEIRLQVPESETADVLVESDSGQQYSKSVETNSLQLEIAQPKDGGLVQDYGDNPDTIDFSFEGSIETEQPGTYDILVNGDSVASGSVDTGTNSVQKDISTNTEGDNELQVSFDDGQTKELSDQVSFTAQWIEDPFNISINSPSSGESIQDYQTTIKYKINYSVSHNTKVYTKLDGQVIDSIEFNDEFLADNTDTGAISKGQHSTQVILQDLEKDQNITSSQISFETTENPPIARLNLESPNEGQTFSSSDNIQVEYSTDVYEDSTHYVWVNGNTTMAPSKSFAASESGTYSFSIGTLDPGDYTLMVQAREDSSSDDIFSRKVNIGVN